MSKNRRGSKIVLIAHNGDAFDFLVLANSLTKFSLLDRVKALDLLFLDSLKLSSSLQVFKEMGGKTKSLSLPCIYNCLFGKDLDAHDELGDCQALSEVFLAVVPDVSVSEFAALMHAVNEVESTAKLRTTIRSRMISMQDLPLSRTMKEKMAKAGIGPEQLKSVFSTNGSRGLMALLAMPAKEQVLMTEKASPCVTNNRKILGKILAFFKRKRLILHSDCFLFHFLYEKQHYLCYITSFLIFSQSEMLWYFSILVLKCTKNRNKFCKCCVVNAKL